MRRSLFPSILGVVAMLASAGVHAASPPITVGYLFSDGNIPGTLKAYEALIKERPDLKDKVKLTLLSESTLDDVMPTDLLNSSVLVLDTMNEQMLEKFNARAKADLVAEVRRHGTVLGVGQGLLGEQHYAEEGVQWDPKARQFWANSGPRNQVALLKIALARAGIKNLDIPEPEPSLDFGFYYSDGKNGLLFADWQAFDAWREMHGKKRPGAPRIAIGFYKASYYSGDTALLDSLIAEIERQGGEAIPTFGYPGAVAFEQLLRDESGHPRADVGLGSNFNFSDAAASRLLEKVGIPVINVVTLYGRNEQDWRRSSSGLSQFEGTFDLAVPELAGTIAPTVVGSKEKERDPLTGIDAVYTRPIKSRVSMAVARAIRYARLRAKPNAEKHLAILFYNYPPGKANIGASYLNVADSLANLLARLKQDGYDVGGEPPDSAHVLADITTQARNVIAQAPGELDQLLAVSKPVRVPLSTYRTWLGELPPVLRQKILKDWGAPEKGSLMTARGKNGTDLILPAVRYGNIVLMPQPSRAWGDDLEKMYHAKDLAPHHQYVAAYIWLRKGFIADAVVHVGTHGTLEWLDGKDVGLSEEDAPDALIADLPDIYLYNVDVVGEGLVARRRGMATLVDHMVPPFKNGGLTQELTRITELLNDHEQNTSKNPELAAEYLKQLKERVMAAGIGKDIGLRSDVAWGEQDLHRLEDYVLDLKGQNIPYGLHAFGRSPEKALRESTVQAIVDTDRSLLPDAKKVLAADMDQRIARSGPRELEDFSLALAGGFIPAAGGGEPIRNPDSYATGNNFYGIDPDKVPKPAAWNLGVKLADQMLEQHVKEHGKYPEKVSFVIWGDETMRHEGVLESQIFRLLGTKPIWNDRGKVVGVEVIPRAQLGRPRVDIVIASAAEGMFNNVTRLMDEAVQRAKAMDEADNVVRQHYLATKAALIAKGFSESDADRRAGVRIFDEPPGTYNLNTSTIVAASGSWDSDDGFANDYIRKMGHGYGNGFWGEPMQDVFRMALSGVDKVVHSSSTSLYGSLDNDDMFMYVGGLAAAVRSVDGKTPEVMVTNTRNPTKPEMTTLDKFVGEEFRSRYVNPTWIQGMQKEGYAGAGEMREFVEYLWGWNATVPDVVDAAKWQETFKVYVQDKYNLGMRNFFEKNSPFAYQDITARMIETIRKDYWKADDDTRRQLLREYVGSVEAHGVSCTAFTCGNARLLQYVLEKGRDAGLPAPDLEAFKQAMQRAIKQDIGQAAKKLADFSASNDAREAREARDARASRDAAPGAATSRADGTALSRASSANAAGASAPAPSATTPSAPAGGTRAASPPSTQPLKGYVMQSEQNGSAATVVPPRPRDSSPLSSLWFMVPLLGALGVWRWRYARTQ